MPKMTFTKYKSQLIVIGAIVLLLIVAIAKCTCEKKKIAPAAEKKITTTQKMLEFIIGISSYSKSIDKQFIIIPQNGSRLAFEKGNPSLPINKSYISAIDAFGIESLFYNSEFTPDSARVSDLKKLKVLKPVLVSEYIVHDNNVADAVAKNREAGFISFTRTKKNNNYEFIPHTTRDENSNDIISMNQVKNYLYLINPSKYKSKEDFIKTIGKTNHDLIIMDLFFNNNVPFTVNDLARLKRKANGGKRLVVCYMNIGSAENWRYYWKKNWRLHSPEFLEKNYEGYDNEYWVRFWDKNWQKIIYGNKDSYTRKIIDAGFDGAYLDNVEAYIYIYK